MINKIEKKLNLSPQTKESVLKSLEVISKQYANVSSASPMIYPLPLCNNNLRADIPSKPKSRNRINIGRIPLSPRKPFIAKKLSIIERSSLIRTEEISWKDMFADAQQNAKDGCCFDLLFPESILKRINSDITSYCMGVPFGVSKSILVKDMACPWTKPAPDDSDAVATLIDNGAVPIGYIQSDPFFFDEDKCSKAVANGLPFALGVDHLGLSLANAARDGVCAIRPTYGLCSRKGLLCKSPSMQQLSIYASDAHDIATILSCTMSGKHNDSTSYFTLLGDWYEQISTIDSREITVAIARNTLDMKANPYSSAAVIKAAEFFSLMGANVVDIEISLPDHVLSTAIVTGESKIEDIARYGTALDELDDRAKGELALKYMLGGTDTLTNARRIRNSLAQSFERTLSNVSVFICPTVSDDGSPSPVLEALALTGICGITVPCGQSSQTSLGLLIAGRQFSEPVILRMCHLYQNANKKLKEASRRGRRAKIPTKN